MNNNVNNTAAIGKATGPKAANNANAKEGISKVQAIASGAGNVETISSAALQQAADAATNL
jgi:hypothetical protein